MAYKNPPEMRDGLPYDDWKKELKTGLGSIQFRNWNCRSIPIPIPELELELELKLVELKMELELKSLELELELELKTGIEFFCNCYCSTY